MQKRPSLQSIRKNRQKEEFVGRESQILYFRQNLALDVEDERRKFIFNITGQGGVGKTTLLRRFSKIAEDARGISAWTDEADENVPTIMKHFVEQLARHQEHIFKKFNESYHTYRQRRQELEADPEAPTTSLDFISHVVTKLGMSFGKRIPVGGALLDFVDEDALASQVSAWSAYIKRKLTNMDEVRLVQEPLEVLTPLFIEGLQKISENHLIALFFDTYEYTGRYLDDWIRKLLEGHYGDIPSNIIVSIAGREELDTNLWIAYEGLLTHFPLEPFTEQEVRELLKRRGIADEKVIEIILKQSHRFPLLVATLAYSDSIDFEQLEGVGDTAIERILKWEDEKQRQVILNAAIPLVLNQDILAVLVGNDNAELFFQWIKQKPFIKERADGWIYHDNVRKPMLHHKLRQSPQSWSTLHGQLADYYEGLRDKLGLRISQRPFNSEWQRYTWSAAYHRACQNPHDLVWITARAYISYRHIVNDDTVTRYWQEVLRQVIVDTEISAEEFSAIRLEMLKEAAEIMGELDFFGKQLDLVKEELKEEEEEKNQLHLQLEQLKKEEELLEKQHTDEHSSKEDTFERVQKHESISKKIKRIQEEHERDNERLNQKSEKLKQYSKRIDVLSEKLGYLHNEDAM